MAYFILGRVSNPPLLCDRLFCLFIAKHYDTMNMVRHYHGGIQFNMALMVGKIGPCCSSDGTHIVQYHFSVNNIAKQTFPLPDTEGHEIIPYEKT